MQRAVNRRAGFFQDADDAKRFVVVLAEAYRADAVRDDNRLVKLIAELGCDIGAKHDIVDVVKRFALG